MTRTPPCCAQADEPPCPQHQQAARVQRHPGPRVRTGTAQRVVGQPGKARTAPQEKTDE